MQLKKKSVVAVAAAFLGVGSIAVADNISVTDAYMMVDSWAEIGVFGDYDYNESNETSNPWNGYSDAVDYGLWGYTYACSSQDTMWDGYSVQSTGVAHGHFDWYAGVDGSNEAVPEEETLWAADAQSSMGLKFTALVNSTFELSVTMASTLGGTSIGEEGSWGSLVNVTTGDVVAEWSAHLDSSLFAVGGLQAGHEYELSAYALGGAIAFGHGHSGTSEFDVSLMTYAVVPLPSAVFAGLLGLGGLGMSRGRRRSTEA